jgi:hypothetical protein
VKLAPIFVASLIVMAACADAPAPSDEGPPNGVGTPLPDVAEIVCEPDGVMRLRQPSVSVQPDGLHVHVDVSLKEPVHVDGLWLDEEVQPGETDLVTINPPGKLTLACWPVSQLDSSSFEPERAELEVLDPDGVYVSEELECLPGDDPGAWTTDFDEHGPDIEPPIMPEQAEAVLSRLEPGDLVTYTGYPERPGKRIAVTRDGRTIASMVFSHEPGGIDAHDGEICSVDAAIPPVIQEEIEHG